MLPAAQYRQNVAQPRERERAMLLGGNITATLTCICAAAAAAVFTASAAPAAGSDKDNGKLAVKTVK